MRMTSFAFLEAFVALKSHLLLDALGDSMGFAAPKLMKLCEECLGLLGGLLPCRSLPSLPSLQPTGRLRKLTLKRKFSKRKTLDVTEVETAVFPAAGPTQCAMHFQKLIKTKKTARVNPILGPSMFAGGAA